MYPERPEEQVEVLMHHLQKGRRTGHILTIPTVQLG
jgi:hypothetical protein